ncbi:hypothetical protein AB45_4732 [Escherichia coli 3-105-05_S1_C2]|nr:hypothetical protein AB45_4732 [Escherichia coli 3-105-05_S1_C2]
MDTGRYITAWSGCGFSELWFCCSLNVSVRCVHVAEKGYF